jgi:hypothetical protein
LLGSISVLRPYTILARILEAGVSTQSVASRRLNKGSADSNIVKVHLRVY